MKAQISTAKRKLSICLLLATSVWSVWLTLLGPISAVNILQTYWPVTLTMMFGSMVAGGTSMGGGAVAFPVLTKLMEVPPHEAKVFALAIQSVGMTTATLTLIAMKTEMDWRLIRWTSSGGLIGIAVGVLLLEPLLPPELIRLSFTMMTSSFALVMIYTLMRGTERCILYPFWGHQERAIWLATGCAGGIISGLVGSGIDIFAFSVMVLLFRMCESSSTPISVVLMAINAIAGFALHGLFLNDFVFPVREYWLASVPIVVVGAPIGAILCSHAQRNHIAIVLLGLILTELVSSLLLIPLNWDSILLSICVLAGFFSFYIWIARAKVK
ncbi:MAG TPA: sulfite exporter TauE/SafE family protein [Elainellaceae cyanobacterium]